MATRYWKGDAQAVSQVLTLTVGGTIEADDLFKITIGSKTLTVTAGSTSAAAVAGNIVAAFNALDSRLYPEFTGSTSGAAAAVTTGGSLTLTAKKEGVPIAVTLAVTEADGSPPDAQTFTQSTTVANSGPNDWSTAANWDGGVLPAGGDDVVIQNSNVDILYGLDQSGVTLASLTIKQNYTGKIGLPRTNSAGYAEYREAYLKISATSVNIGEGEGAGSGRIKLNTGSNATTVNVFNTGTTAEPGVKAILWRGAHASNVVNVNKGSFAAAPFAGETATIATLRQGYRTNQTGDTDVLLGAGCTLTTLNKSGGALEVNSSFTTLTQGAGETVLQAGTPSTVHLNGGQLRWRSGSGATTVNVSDGAELDFRQDMRAKTIATLNLYAKAIVRDPFEVATITSGYVLQKCDIADVTLDIGTDITLVRS